MREIQRSIERVDDPAIIRLLALTPRFLRKEIVIGVALSDFRDDDLFRLPVDLSHQIGFLIELSFHLKDLTDALFQKSPGLDAASIASWIIAISFSVRKIRKIRVCLHRRPRFLLIGPQFKNL